MSNKDILNCDVLEEVVPSYKTEFKRILKLFIPIILGQLAQTAMSVVDTIMAGWAGVNDLSGVAIGSSFFWPALFFIVGLSLAIQPIVSQLRGQNNLTDINKHIVTAFLVCFLVSLLTAVIVYNSSLVYNYVDDIDEDMVSVASGYLKAVALGLPGFALFNVMRSYSEGLGNTLPTLIFGLVALTLNIPLNYIFIFGHLGLSAFGGVGCGIATSVTIYLTCIIFYIYIQRAKFYEKVRVLNKFCKVSFKDIINYLRVGFPLALSVTVEVSCFSLVAFLLSPFGKEIVGAHSIALNLSGLLYIIPMSLASCATIRVGEAMGTLHWNRAIRTFKTALIMGFFIYITSFILVMIFKDNIISLFTQDENVKEIAVYLIFLCCMYMLPDSIQVIVAGVLRGFKDSKIIFLVTIIAYWVVCMPLGYALAYGYIDGERHAAAGFWYGFIFGLITAAIIYSSRALYLFKYRKIPKVMQDTLHG